MGLAARRVRDRDFPNASSHKDVKPQVYDRLAVTRSLPSLDAGCIQDILVLYPSGGEAVQIGYPADLSGIHDRNDGLFLTPYTASLYIVPTLCVGMPPRTLCVRLFI